MPTRRTKERARVDAVTKLLMKHESYLQAYRATRSPKLKRTKIAAEQAASAVLTLLLGRTPTPDEVETALWK